MKRKSEKGKIGKSKVQNGKVQKHNVKSKDHRLLKEQHSANKKTKITEVCYPTFSLIPRIRRISQRILDLRLSQKCELCHLHSLLYPMTIHSSHFSHDKKSVFNQRLVFQSTVQMESYKCHGSWIHPKTRSRK